MPSSKRSLAQLYSHERWGNRTGKRGPSQSFRSGLNERQRERDVAKALVEFPYELDVVYGSPIATGRNRFRYIWLSTTSERVIKG